jgi:hypothetical protein
VQASVVNENPVKVATPCSFKMTSSSGSMHSSEKHRAEANVSDLFSKLPLQSGYHKKLKPNILQVITNI